MVESRREILEEMYRFVGANLLDRWYPLAVDRDHGGYFTDIAFDWKIEPVQHKMIVTQARHIWTASKAAIFFNNETYASSARHGYDFLKSKMWDREYGGFYQMRDRSGGMTDYLGFFGEKRTYGNAFAVFALAALYQLTGNPVVLDFASEAFEWIEEHSSDKNQKGYFQFLTPDGTPYDRLSAFKTKAYDEAELGYKDQNSSIHLLEAYTELYRLYPDPHLRDTLLNLLYLVRDVITTNEGYMNLFFHNDWTPVSFRNAPQEIRESNYRLDHVSFGHNYETAYLMLEASSALGLRYDTKTLSTARKMVDHAIANGWDTETGGFFDAGYCFPGDDRCAIIQSTKNWWSQAEALNILLLMSRIFPDTRVYQEYFKKEWDYVKKYLLDYEHGEWFEGGLDKEPHFRRGPKSHIWKCSYHTGRSMMNCIKILAGEDFQLNSESSGFKSLREESMNFIGHWKKTAATGELSLSPQE